MKHWQTGSIISVSNRDQIQKKRGVYFSQKTDYDFGKYFLLIGIIALLAACMQGVPLTKDKMVSIESVCISSEMQKPKQININFQQRKKPASSSWSSILLTAAAEGVEHASKAVALRRTYSMSGISIDSILKEQFENELKQSNIFKSVVSSEGDAAFQFQIMNYGFDENYFDRKMRPKLWIKASLVTSEDIILWDQQVHCCAAEKSVHSHSQSEFYGDRELMRQSLTEAAKASCARLIDDMKKDLESK